jgi:hypothetical protein
MKLADNIILDGKFIPRGVDIDPALIPPHIKKESGLITQPKKKVPKNYQGPRYADAQGKLITDWGEHLAAQQEHLEAEQKAFETVNDEIAYYDTRLGQHSDQGAEDQP